MCPFGHCGLSVFREVNCIQSHDHVIVSDSFCSDILLVPVNEKNCPDTCTPCEQTDPLNGHLGIYFCIFRPGVVVLFETRK